MAATTSAGSIRSSPTAPECGPRREAEALAERMADSLPASEVMPALAEALASRRGPHSGAVGLDLMLPAEVVAANAR